MASGVEADVGAAYDLLNRSRWEALTEDEWMTLSVLIESVRNALWAFEDEWKDRLQRLWEEGGLSTSDTVALSASQGRFDAARRLFDSGDMFWKATVRPIRTTLPVGRRTPVFVESRMVSGTALGGRFPGGFPAQEGAQAHSSALLWYLNSLDETVLTGADGEVLFSGLRHVDIRPENLAGWRVAGVRGEALRVLIDWVYRRELGQFRTEARTGGRQVPGFLIDLREARSTLARVVVTAALVADPAKLRRAIEGETVDFHLGVVSLPGTRYRSSWEHERRAFATWSRPAVRLQVNGPDGEPRSVRANVAVSQFTMGHGDGLLFADGANDFSLQDLLGPCSTGELGGAVAVRVRRIPDRVAELRSELVGLSARRLRTTRQPGAEPAGAVPIGRPPTRTTNEMYRLERAMRRLEIGARALEEAGRQVKSVWIDSLNEPVSDEVRRQVAARLSLIACLMDWVPVTVARIGYPAADTVDAEVKFLATVADCNAGRLPPVERDAVVWGPARSAFDPR